MPLSVLPSAPGAGEARAAAAFGEPRGRVGGSRGGA